MNTTYIIHGDSMTNAEILRKVRVIRTTCADPDTRYIAQCAINKANESNNFMHAANMLRGSEAAFVAAL